MAVRLIAKKCIDFHFLTRIISLKPCTQQKLVIDEEVANAWGRLTSDSSDVSWIAAGYPAAGNNLQISVSLHLTGCDATGP